MNHLKRYALALLLATMVSSPAWALTIDYAYVSTHDFNTLGQGAYDAIGQQSWLFTHASVGGNMVAGMNTLRSDDANTYQLRQVSVGSSTTPSGTPGVIHDWNRGNPGWQSKYDIFKAAVESGWGNSADFVMDKLCYIDQRADANVYLQMMNDLESRYAATFVYTTMPLTTAVGGSNDLRNRYNEAVRAYAEANNKLLFDIADLEAHDRNGNEYTYTTYNGTVYQTMWNGWTSDGGHLDANGRVWVAEGWYAVAASQATPIPGTALLLGCGLGGLGLIRRKFSPVKPV